MFSEDFVWGHLIAYSSPLFLQVPQSGPVPERMGEKTYFWKNSFLNTKRYDKKHPDQILVRIEMLPKPPRIPDKRKYLGPSDMAVYFYFLSSVSPLYMPVLFHPAVAWWLNYTGSVIKKTSGAATCLSSKSSCYTSQNTRVRSPEFSGRKLTRVCWGGENIK